jgi:hypothetical protein
MDCIHYHENQFAAWCDYEDELGMDMNCDECPYYYSKEDYENDLADYKCDTYRDFL